MTCSTCVNHKKKQVVCWSPSVTEQKWRVLMTCGFDCWVIAENDDDDNGYNLKTLCQLTQFLLEFTCYGVQREAALKQDAPSHEQNDVYYCFMRTTVSCCLTLQKYQNQSLSVCLCVFPLVVKKNFKFVSWTSRM